MDERFLQDTGIQAYTGSELLLKGWVKARWTVSESGREVREYSITASGRKQLEAELAEYRRVTQAIETLLNNA